ncbi:DDE superfamily endonuclease [Hirsutella rhossiliensis]
MKYTESDIHSALEAIANGGSAKKAARDWGVRGQLFTIACMVTNAERMHFLLFRGFQTQEKQLTEWILIQDALGLPPTHSQIRQFAQRMLAVKGDHTPLGKHWMQAFLRRNPAVRTQKCHHRDSARVNGASTEVIRPWFNNFFLPEILAIKPENRYNMDEAGIMEGLGENGLVVGSAEKRSVQKKTPGSRVWTSFIECVSAAGTFLLHSDWQFTATKNGWTSDQTAVEWLEKVFIPRTQPPDPSERRLLVLDGHGSHETVDFMSDSQPPDRFKPSRQAKLSFLLPESTRASAHCVKHQGWLESDGFVAGVDGEATLSPLLLENSNRRKRTRKMWPMHSIATYPPVTGNQTHPRLRGRPRGARKI